MKTEIMKILFTLFAAVLLSVSCSSIEQKAIEPEEQEEIYKIKLLLENGFDVNARDSSGKTGLMKASAKGHLEAVKLLLENGADAKGNNGGWSVLHHASYNGHLEVVKLLLENGADVNAKDKYGFTALMWVDKTLLTEARKKEIKALLIKNGAK